MKENFDAIRDVKKEKCSCEHDEEANRTTWCRTAAHKRCENSQNATPQSRPCAPSIVGCLFDAQSATATRSLAPDPLLQLLRSSRSRRHNRFASFRLLLLSLLLDHHQQPIKARKTSWHPTVRALQRQASVP